MPGSHRFSGGVPDLGDRRGMVSAAVQQGLTAWVRRAVRVRARTDLSWTAGPGQALFQETPLGVALTDLTTVFGSPVRTGQPTLVERRVGVANRPSGYHGDPPNLEPLLAACALLTDAARSETRPRAWEEELIPSFCLADRPEGMASYIAEHGPGRTLELPGVWRDGATFRARLDVVEVLDQRPRTPTGGRRGPPTYVVYVPNPGPEPA